MKLSEAIRVGSEKRPQGFGASFKNGHTCAIGAAMDAIGHADNDYTKVLDYFPITHLYVTSPETGQSVVMLTALRELNDEYRWTREQIANFVAEIEASGSGEERDR